MRMCEKGRGWTIARETVHPQNSRDRLRPLNRQAEPRPSSRFGRRTRVESRNVAKERGQASTHAHLNEARRFLRQPRNPPLCSFNPPLTFKGPEPFFTELLFEHETSLESLRCARFNLRCLLRAFPSCSFCKNCSNYLNMYIFV